MQYEGTYWHTLVMLGAAVLLLAGVSFVHAQSVDELKNKINTRQLDIEQLEEEILQYERELTAIGREKQTLQSAVRELDISRQKLQSSISLTQKRIDGAQENIDELAREIIGKEQAIQRNEDALAEVIRRMDESESASFVEVLLGSENLSSVWSDMDTLFQFQGVVRDRVSDLVQHKRDFEEVKAESEAEQQQLVSYRGELSSQKHGLDLNRNAKNDLLRQTQSTESTYQDILEEKRRAKEEFEAELREF
ncbi:MAG: hypothetical protein Q8P16_00255, partial [bacterium]|nr:hypothetical protein [bacterium]